MVLLYAVYAAIDAGCAVELSHQGAVHEAAILAGFAVLCALSAIDIMLRRLRRR